MFATLSEEVRLKIFDTVLCTAFNELKLVLEPVINEERKMHESLKKYQKSESQITLSDFDKMLIQYYVVSP
jgi:hypothetical protein